MTDLIYPMVIFLCLGGSDTTILRTESQKDIQLALENVFVDLKKKTFQLGDLQLQTKDIDIPLDNGFYRLENLGGWI